MKVRAICTWSFKQSAPFVLDTTVDKHKKLQTHYELKEINIRIINFLNTFCFNNFNLQLCIYLVGRDVSTSSAGVQTTPPDPSTLPPPYVWSTESSNLTEISIPRCPSYIKDPPQYGTWTLADKYDTSDNTNEDDSHQGIEMITNTTPEPDVVIVVCPSMTQENDSTNVERNTTIENTNV